MRSVAILLCCVIATETGAQWTHASCPLPPNAVGYPVTAGSAALDATTLMSIARGAAGSWPSDSLPADQPQIRARGEIMQLMPRPAVHPRSGWVPSASDTATMTLHYVRDSDVRVSIDTTTAFARKLSLAMASEVTRARLGYVQHDTLPLRLPGVDSANVAVRFGYEPARGQVVTRFAMLERQARPANGTRGPTYPSRLRSRNVEGQVVAMFLILPSGRVLPRTIRFSRSSHPDFSISVREALENMVFEPAAADCNPTTAFATQPFNFYLSGGRFPGARIP
jgi:TonB family protein